MTRRTLALLAGIMALAGCVAPPKSGGPGYVGQVGPVGQPGAGAPAGRTVAILAPLTGPNAERGQALVAAAKLALAAPGSPTLDVRDTGGTPDGAAMAAKAAIAAGDGLLIGPLTAAETAAAAGPATAGGVAMLAFTNDSTQARAGVWTLGLTPAQQVRRLVGAATTQGKTRFAALLPSSDFGQSMASALTQATSSAGVAGPDIRMYGGGTGSISSSVRDLSGYATRRAPLDAQIKAARAAHTAEGRQLAADLSRQGVAPPPFDALVLADTGERLAEITSFLSYYDVDPSAVRLLGPALWAAPAARAGASLNGAWFAAPDPAGRADFDAQYTTATGGPAPGLADLAYDAASIARVLATEGGGYSAAALCRPDGFAGVDGVLALQPDGRVRRGLALFEVRRGGPQLIEPAPASLSAPGI